MNNKDIKLGLKMGTPIALGYAPIAMTFGMLAKSTNVTFLEAFSFSAFVYAGASQFMALNLLHVGTSVTGIIIATFLLNMRHFLMSASLSTKISKKDYKWIPLIASGVTDESFSITSMQKGSLSKEYFLTIHLMIYSSWVINTLVGYILGELLPKSLGDSMVMGLYAMFIAILFPELKKSWKVCSIVILAGLINYAAKNMSFIPLGWSIVISIISASYLGVLLSSKEEVVANAK
jgi:4-azaleucine resistance transporter AzlC